MATAEELLTGGVIVDKTLIISNDLRTITIPSSVNNLGVESDNEVLRLHFKMPRYIGDLDLSTFSIRINYLNAQAEGDVYTVSDASVESEYITFSWLVGPTATRYKGETKFNVCLVTLTSDGYVDREFNTTIASLKVLEGLETDESLVEQYSDVLEQWRRELFSASNAGTCVGLPEIYVGSGDMPEGYVIQIDPDGEDAFPAVSYKAQTLTEEQKAQARENIGTLGYYTTPREEIGVSHESITADYIWGLYDALMAKYPGKVQKKEVCNDDGTFINYAYVISTGEYNTEGYNGGNDSDGDGYEDYLDRDIKKKKYIILSGIHGCERKAALSAYRFILDLLRGHNMPTGFLESSVFTIVPVGNPSGFTAFTRTNDEGVDINRNFDWNWEETNAGTSYYSGASVASEKETQAIVNWLNENRDAELFVDCHNCSAVNEVASIMGLADDEETDRAKKIALRGLDRIIPYWRDVIGYTAHEARPNGTVLPPVYSYSTSMPINGAVAYYAADALGIPSMALEMSTLQNGDFSDWYENQHLVTPETIAAGAEIIGNILIEFYMDTSEVVNMAGVNNRLDILAESMESMSRGFRTESGVLVADADMLPPEGSSNFWLRVPCSNGAKMVVFHADSETLTAIKATSGIKYLGSIMVNCFAPEVADEASTPASYMSIMNFVSEKYGWKLLGGSSSNAENTDGVRFKVFALKAGSYNWTAYYWND